MARKKRVIEDIEVIDIADRGHSIGRTPEGEIVIVMDQAVPGDKIDLIYTKKKKGLKHGLVERYVHHSEHRVDPRCEHFGTCGGCKWQHFDYARQLHHKENSVRQSIRRIAKDDEAKVGSIIGAEDLYNYRNKLEYSFSSKRWLTIEEIQSDKNFDQERGLGFHISGAFDKVLNIEQCHLQGDYSNTIRNTLRDLAAEHSWSYYDIRNHKGLLRNVMVRNSSLGQWMVVIIYGSDDLKKIEEVNTALQAALPKVDSWHYIINLKANSSTSDLDAVHISGPTHIEEKLGQISYRISPKSFFQTHSKQAKVLYDTAVELANLQGEELVYDLYTGTGSIALYVAQTCKHVVGIEVIPEAIQDAVQNAERNDISNTTFLVGDVKDVLDPSFEQIHGAPDVVITDPPRAGMHQDVIDTLLSLGSHKIVYISCNPSTQARDILLLKEKYDLIKVIPVDMFPHTSHIESVALLTLR